MVEKQHAESVEISHAGRRTICSAWIGLLKIGREGSLFDMLRDESGLSAVVDISLHDVWAVLDHLVDKGESDDACVS
jgi:hypothetical protein